MFFEIWKKRKIRILEHWHESPHFLSRSQTYRVAPKNVCIMFYVESRAIRQLGKRLASTIACMHQGGRVEHNV